MKPALIIAVVVALLLTASCGAPGDADRVSELEEENEQLRERIGELETELASMIDVDDEDQRPGAWSEEGLFYQPEMPRLEALGQEYGFAPGTTDWHESEPERYQAFTEDGEKREESAAALLTSLAGELPLSASLGRDLWEIALRIMHEDNEATGVIMYWGLKDDATAGIDYQVSMQAMNGRWVVTAMQERYHCRRGVCEAEQICQ